MNNRNRLIKRNTKITPVIKLYHMLICWCMNCKDDKSLSWGLASGKFPLFSSAANKLQSEYRNKSGCQKSKPWLFIAHTVTTTPTGSNSQIQVLQSQEWIVMQ